MLPLLDTQLIGISRIICRGCWRVCAKRVQFFVTTPTTAGIARGGCGLVHRRSETDRGENNILTAYM